MADQGQVPSIGRMVHYILPDGPSVGQHRPAIIVRTWGDVPASAVQLVVFVDGRNDDPLTTPAGPAIVRWQSSVCYGDEAAGAVGTWHWPEHVPAQG